MNLSKRLEMNVSLVPQGARVADIGCDHGYASIWLVRHGISEKVIALDVNRGPIERAKEHIRQAGLEKQIECRLSDGTEKLSPGEADTLMLAGMGGPLMIRILEAGNGVLEKADTLVLQPQSEIGEVRRFLFRHGFQITKEKACVEDGKYYFAICARRSGYSGDETFRHDWEYRYGTYLIQHRDPVLWEYLQKERDTCLSIMKKLELSSKNVERRTELENMLEDIEQCLRHFRDGREIPVRIVRAGKDEQVYGEDQSDNRR